MSPAFTTRAVHAGRHDLSAEGVHAPPIDLSTTYPIADLGEAARSIEALAGGHPPEGNPVYARLHNPTTARFEGALAELEGADAAVAFSSGMAALTACLLAARMCGARHVVAVRPLYGGSDHLLAGGLLDLEVDFVRPGAVGAAIRPDTGLVIVETPANPTLDVVDLRALVKVAGRVPVLVDSTFATPVLQRPLEHGAAMVLHSATKMIGGHGDVLAGVVATSEAWAGRLRQVRIATGAVLHPLGAYLLHRGLQTLALRVEAAQRGARRLAERLATHPEVLSVRYPGLSAPLPPQMAGPGTLLAFEVEGGAERARGLMAELGLITPAVSLGSADTLIQHPASLTHQVVSAEGKAEGGISDGLMRLSVGLEDPDDLWRDLRRALEASAVHGLRQAS